MIHCLLLFKLRQAFQDFLAVKEIQYYSVLRDLNQFRSVDKFPFPKIALFMIFR